MDAGFRQELSLPDDRRVRLRWMRRSDAPLVREGFERLSAPSRFARFHTLWKELPAEVLGRLTDVDGVDHCALLAVDEQERAIGVARFVRTEHDAASAEIAVTIADEVQGLGLAARMLGPLADAARARGIAYFVGYVLSENVRAQRLLRKLGAEWVGTGRGVATYRLALGTGISAQAA